MILMLIAAAALFFLYYRSKEKNGKGNTFALIGGFVMLLLAFWKDAFAALSQGFSGLFIPAKDTSGNTTFVNACGCSPGELVRVKFKPAIGKTRWQNMSCENALALQAKKPNRTSFNGCVPKTAPTYSTVH